MRNNLTVFVLVLIMSTGVQSADAKPAHTLMPVPADVEFGTGKLIISSEFPYRITGPESDRLNAAVDRFLNRLSQNTGIFLDRADLEAEANTADPVLFIEIERVGQLVLGEDESYSMQINDQSIMVTSATDLGALHALETLLQLLDNGDGRYFFPAVEINDRPRFPWRGLMLDVCRHFQPVGAVKRQLDAMALVKLNVLHLHLSEDQGFRVESKVYPRLHRFGSDGKYFTQTQIQEIIDYAADRGIRVVPEFDMPGHSTSWLVGYPELAAIDSIYSIERGWGVKNPVLNPINETTYEFLDNFIGEMAGLFPDQYFHIGGDENNGKHWSRSAEIRAFMAENGYENTHQMQTYFIDRVKGIVAGHGKTVVGWDEIFDPGMDQAIITQFWSHHGMEKMTSAMESGFRGIVSNGYYIDLFWPAERHYLMDPVRNQDLAGQPAEANILGGEATAWAEFITPELIDRRIWPRTAAIAERYWSPASVNDVDDMYRRLARTSLRLERIGLNHRSTYEALLRRLSNGQSIDELKTLADLCEPVENYRRHRFDENRQYRSYSPLTRLVDAVACDAIEARHFRRLMDTYLKSLHNLQDELAESNFWQRKSLVKAHVNSDAYRNLAAVFAQWKNVNRELAPIIAGSPVLLEIKPLAQRLSKLAAVGEEALTLIAKNDYPTDLWLTRTGELIEESRQPAAELELRIVEPLAALVSLTAGEPLQENDE